MVYRNVRKVCRHFESKCFAANCGSCYAIFPFLHRPEEIAGDNKPRKHCKKCKLFKPWDSFSNTQLKKAQSKCWDCCNPNLFQRREARYELQKQLQLRPDFGHKGSGDHVPRHVVNQYIEHTMNPSACVRLNYKPSAYITQVIAFLGW